MGGISSFLLAIIGLSFLIFIHELGHYLVAIRAKMKVEVFSIGFGRPIFSFFVKGVKWQIGSLPFGGFVKIAGMEKTEKKEPHEVEGGFYASSPYQRIAVAIAGPLVNIVFSIFVFTLLFFLGGRIQSFSQHTRLIGAVDPKRVELTLKPGDSINSIDGNPIHSFQDLLYASVIRKKEPFIVDGDRIDYFNRTKTPYSLKLSPYQDQDSAVLGLNTIGIKAPAQYLIYGGAATASQIEQAGFQPQDRIIWVNGELIFSVSQLSSVINQEQVLLTVQRGNRTFLTRVPRLKIADLRLNQHQKEELLDYKHALQLILPITQLDFIPYDVNSKGVVESAVPFIDENARQSTVYSKLGQEKDSLLKKGDKIIAVSGETVSTAVDLFSKIQQKKVVVIVERKSQPDRMTTIDQDQVFFNSYHPESLSGLISSIGVQDGKKENGFYCLLKPITPMTKKQLLLEMGREKQFQIELDRKLREIDKIKDQARKEYLLKEIDEFNQTLMLGISLEDRKVVYNPTPWQQIEDVFNQTKRTFYYLLTGQISPKWLAGPVGMVQMVQHSVSLGFKEALYWMGLISLNLAIFNLLPLPILDGGHIVMALYEQITKKRIPSRVKELIMIPFMFLLIGLLIFVTFHDLARIFSRFFH